MTSSPAASWRSGIAAATWGRCLSLVLIAQAALAERSADVDNAEALLSESTRLAGE